MLSHSFYGFGYEGKTQAELISTLKTYEITTLIDVRLTPISRKKGLSKTKLREAVEAAGMTYLHLPALGNPKDNRAGFYSPYSEAWANARANFLAILETDAARTSLLEAQSALESGNVGLLCFEANEKCCHRDVVLESLKSADRRPAYA